MDVTEQQEQEKPPERAEENGKRKVPAITRMQNEDAQGVSDYLRSFAGSGPSKVKIFRNQPTMWHGKQIAGLIETTDDLLTEEDIQARYGGGKYTVQVHIQKDDGKGWRYAGQRQVVIAGDPRLDNMPDFVPERTVQPLTPKEDDGLVRSALSMVERTAAHERERASRLEAEMRENAGKAGLDMSILETISRILQPQVDAANRRAESLEQRLAAQQEKKPEPNPMQDALVEKILSDDNARLNTVREAHNSELRAMRENHQAELTATKTAAREDLKRAEDRADRMLDMTEKTHAREVDGLRQGHQTQLENLKASFEARLAVYEGENRRLHKELEERKIELTELRGKKEKSPTDQILEFAQLKDALDTLQGNEDKEPQSTAEKIFDKVSPLLEAVGQRVMAPQQAAQQPVNPAVMQAMMQQAVQQPQVPKVLKKKPKLPTMGQSAAPTPIVIEELATAVNLIEGAINNGQDPQAFASTIQSLVPGNIIHAIKSVGGFEKFLVDRVQLGVNSPILSQQGRNFIRKVEKILLGTAEE